MNTETKNSEDQNAAEFEAGAEGQTSSAPSQEGPCSPEELAQLRSQAAKARELQDMLLRTAAEFDNYKKRIAREKQEAAKYVNEPILQKLIPVLDNFEMAFAASGSNQNVSVQSLQTGVNMILSQLKSVLSETGLEGIDAVGQKFDPNIHEALSQQETADVPEGQVVQQLRRGYKLRDRLLRPAAVVVSKSPEKNA
ncbi:MAG: GrpE protein [Verrucomicrobiales bacterium]|jgi:molecular chaperone GrpE|nr:GrpE protein [Verrucomicrobiales bacterium]